MIIQISAGGDGWSNYVINGTKEKPRDSNFVKVLRGDLDLGDKIVKVGKWNQNAYHIVLSFKGKVNKDTIENVLNEFESNFMIGFDKSEYHFDAVLHQDTDDDHVHIRIPKMNLITQTQLRLYFDKKDRKRLEILRDFFDTKYNLESPLDNIKLIKDEKDLIINKWRDEQFQEKFDFTKKKNRIEAEKIIQDIVIESHKNNEINCSEDLIDLLKKYGLSVEKFGYDMPNNFYYVTVSNAGGKIRAKGEIFAENFWKLDRKQRLELVDKNLSYRTLEVKTSIENIKSKLEKANEIRLRYVEKTYSKARDESQKNYIDILKNGQEKSESTEETILQKGDNNDRVIAGNLQRIRAEREAQQRAIREHTNKRRVLLESIRESEQILQNRIEQTSEDIYSKFRRYASSIQEFNRTIYAKIERFRDKIDEYLKYMNKEKRVKRKNSLRG